MVTTHMPKVGIPMSKTSCQTQIHGENNMFYGMTVRQTQHRLMYFSKKKQQKKTLRAMWESM